MASKKKLRKRINALLMELDARTAALESRERDLRVVLEGKDTNRILQIRTRTRIMDDMGKWLWYGETKIGKGFMHQIQDQVADVPGEYTEELKDASHDGYSEKFLSEGMVELPPKPYIKYDFSQLNTQTDGLKKEEKKEEVRLPETDK